MEHNFVKIGIDGFYCCGCWKPIPTNGLVAACPDCGAVYCKACVELGKLDTHNCEDEED